LKDKAGPKVTEEAGQDNWQDKDMEDKEGTVKRSMTIGCNLFV
jgi:hypothetical protein